MIFQIVNLIVNDFFKDELKWDLCADSTLWNHFHLVGPEMCQCKLAYSFQKVMNICLYVAMHNVDLVSTI